MESIKTEKLVHAIYRMKLNPQSSKSIKGKPPLSAFVDFPGTVSPKERDAAWEAFQKRRKVGVYRPEIR